MRRRVCRGVIDIRTLGFCNSSRSSSSSLLGSSKVRLFSTDSNSNSNDSSSTSTNTSISPIIPSGKMASRRSGPGGPVEFRIDTVGSGLSMRPMIDDRDRPGSESVPSGSGTLHQLHVQPYLTSLTYLLTYNHLLLSLRHLNMFLLNYIFMYIFFSISYYQKILVA